LNCEKEKNRDNPCNPRYLRREKHCEATNISMS